jgi:D-alanyl-lipoteichoic acid acyltransferase DltB (MBOAT superfamily)
MNFTSFAFVAFYLFVLGACGLLRTFSAEKWFLLVTSIFFCLTAGVSCAILILFIALVDFSIGLRLGRTKDPVHRKRLLILSLLSSLGLLGFFKYTNFFLENLWFALGALGFQFPPIRLNITAPPGMSFFTFTSVSYIVAVYNRRLTPCGSLRDYLLFLSFFPKLLAGPIVRAVNFLPQLKQRVRPTGVDIETGFAYLLVGAVKKVVIADQVAGHVNLIFSAPAQFDGFTLLQGLLGFAVQIYCDFSGYSDMAVGLARLLGFQFPENFQMPFAAVTITEFWRRWHITMSNWFRDYLFYPMELARKQSRHPTFRTASDLTATMLVCGLWHGAGWNFVVWGGIHGLAMATQLVWRVWNPLVSLKDCRLFQLGWTFLSRVLTLGVVLLSFVYFRAESIANAGNYLNRLLSWSSDGTRMISPYILPAVAVVVLVHVLQNKDRNWPREIPTRSAVVRFLAYTCLLLLLVTLGATDNVPFIYFQF